MTFGFRTYYKEFDSTKYKPGLVKMYANHEQGYLEKGKIKRGREYIDCWKVFIPEAVGIGNMKADKLKPILGEKGSASTETYIMNGPYENKKQAENAKNILKQSSFISCWDY